MPRALVVPLAALTALGLAACSSGDGDADADAGASTRAADAAACPGEVLDVVVSVGQWGDVVERLAGDCADVTTIVSSGAVDPHDFEPGTGDLAAFEGAQLVVLNGAHYDEWAENALATLEEEPAVVSAAEVAGVPEEGVDPHLWYDPAIVQATASAVTDALAALAPGSEGYFAEQAQAWQVELRPYLDAVDELRALAPDATYAATETVFDRLAAHVGLTDVTPEGYRRAVSNESEPSPGDVAEFETLLADGGADVLVVNSQSGGSLTDSLVDAATEAGSVPTVSVTESPADADGSFVEWQVAQLEELRAALEGSS